MANGKIAAGGLFLLLVVVGALVPEATADACTEECYKECDKQGKKKDDVPPSCTDTCDGICRLKAATRDYAAATTAAEKDAVMEDLDKQALAAGSAAAASTPGFAKLKSGCVRECHNNNKDDAVCRAKGSEAEVGKDEDCTEWCDTSCRAVAEGLTFAAEAYANTPDAERKATIQAIDNRAATRPDHNVEAFAATCMGGCSKVCDKDPDCLTICDNGCRARAVAVVVALATPADKEAISKDIQQAAKAAGSPPPVA
uniref:Uncharacterized protein n=1 Tax=Avena sativa TaxID=4498 RepID=A0ACD5ZE98_AVESA